MDIIEVHIKRRFPAFHLEISRLRKANNDLDEMCKDLEALSHILLTQEDELEPRALQDLRNSIRGLETEILTAIAQS